MEYKRDVINISSVLYAKLRVIIARGGGVDKYFLREPAQTVFAISSIFWVLPFLLAAKCNIMKTSIFTSE